MIRRLVSIVLLALLIPITPTAHAERYMHPNPAVERWHATALEAGWTEAEWPQVSCIINRESMGKPWVVNHRDPGYGSWGLMQLNASKGKWGTWRLWAARLNYRINNLLDPATNLRLAHELHDRAARMWGRPWRPWGGRCG